MILNASYLYLYFRIIWMFLDDKTRSFRFFLFFFFSFFFSPALICSKYHHHNSFDLIFCFLVWMMIRMCFKLRLWEVGSALADENLRRAQPHPISMATLTALQRLHDLYRVRPPALVLFLKRLQQHSIKMLI